MGCCYTFQYSACGYKAEVSGGGDGDFFAVITRSHNTAAGMLWTQWGLGNLHLSAIKTLPVSSDSSRWEAETNSQILSNI